MHAIAVCACFNYMSRLVEGTGITGEDAIVRAAAERLITSGYI